MTFNGPLAERICDLSLELGATPFILLLACFYELMRRYSNQEDIVIATPLSGNGRRTGNAAVFGFEANLVPIRCIVDRRATLAELLDQLKGGLLGAYRNQGCPWELPAMSPGIAGTAGGRPLLPVVFRQFIPDSLHLKGCKVGFKRVKNKASFYDLEVSVREAPGAIRVIFDSSPEAFEGWVVKAMCGHLGAIIGDALENSRKPLLDLGRPSASRLPFRPGTGDGGPKDGLSIPEEFRKRVAESGGLPAYLSVAGTSVSYGALGARVSELAAVFRRIGLGPSRCVALYMERSADLAASILAALELGAAVMPLDAGYPPAYARRILDGSRPSCMVIIRGSVSVPANWSLAASLGELEVFSRPETGERPGRGLDGISFVLHTSGSTGVPKGVLIHQGQFLNRFAWMWREFPFRAGEVLCHRTSIGFSPSLWEILGGLLRGIPSVILPDEIAKSPKALLEAMAASRVTRIVVVPSLLASMLDCADAGAQIPAIPGIWTCLGEPLSPNLCRRFYSHFPESVLLNQYGATEVCDVLWYDTRQLAPGQETVPAGKPIDNMRVRILDGDLREAPDGAAGGIFAEGLGVSEGYLGKPELTGERFIRNSDPQGRGGRLYMMGDLGRRLPDGNVECLGRLDRMVKVRGNRVELGEIEKRLRMHPEVEDAAAVLAEDPHFGSCVAAFVVSGPHASRDSAALRGWLRQEVPSQMVPDILEFVTGLPLTPSGKIDRSKLSAAGRENVPSRGPIPTTRLEEAVMEVWESILGRKGIGLDENFFDAGGNSLLMAGVCQKISDQGLGDLSIMSFFRNPNIKAIAAYLDAQRAAGTNSADRRI